MKQFRAPDFDPENLPKALREKIEEVERKQNAWLIDKLGWVGKIIVVVTKRRKPNPWVVY